MKKIILLFSFSLSVIAVSATMHTVTVANFHFTPTALTVTVGDTISWEWVSGSHTTTSLVIPTGAVPWDSDIKSSHPNYLYRVTVAGNYSYECTPHGSMGMTGTVTVLAGAAAIVFQKDYGTTDSTSDAFASCIQQTNDGGYIATGYISNFGAGGDDIYLVKTNNNGNVEWTKTFGGGDDDDANYVVQTSSGGYAIGGVTLSYGGENIFLIKTNSIGDTLWTKIYGSGDTLSDASASSFQQTSDGGYVFTGYISNYGAGGDDYYLLKTDSNGNIAWAKTYGGTSDDDANAVIQTDDGGYMMAGTTNSFADTLGDIYLVKTNAVGDTLWTKAYASGLSDAMDMGNSIRQTSDHGYIIAGVTVSASVGEFARLLKIDSTGVIEWTKLYGTGNSSSDASLSSVQQTLDGGYITAGYISNFGAGDDDYYLIKTNSNGDTSWTRTYGSAGSDDANFVRQTTDGGYILGGVTVGFEAGGEHLYLVKTDDAGHTTCDEYNTQTTIVTSIAMNFYYTNTMVSSGGIASNPSMMASSGGVEANLCNSNGVTVIFKTEGGVTVYPNPFSYETTIRLDAQLKNGVDCRFKLYDVLGNQVREINISGEQQFTLKKGDLPNGIYFYEIKSNAKMLFSGKMVIED